MSFSFTDLQIAEQEQDAVLISGMSPPPMGTYIEDNNPHSSIKTWSVITFFVVGIYLLMIVFCLVVNGIFGAVLFCSIKSSKVGLRPFYRLVWQIIVANILAALSNCFTILPITFMNKAESKDFISSGTYAVFSGYDTLGDQIILLATLLIAVHRVCIFVFPYMAEKYFQGKNLTIIIGVIWVIGAVIAFLSHFFDCSYKYDAKISMYDYTCTSITNKFTVNKIELTLLWENIILPLATFGCYLFVLFKVIRMKSHGIRLNTAELEVLKQATVLFIVFGFSTMVTLTGVYLPISEENTFLVARMVNTIWHPFPQNQLMIRAFFQFELLAGTTTPLLFFFTSFEIREGLARLQRCRLSSGLQLLSAKVSSVKPSNPPTPPMFLSPRGSNSAPSSSATQTLTLT